MVKTRSGKGFWEDPSKVMETVIINKKIKQDFSKFAKEHKINKSKLIQEFYKSILLKIFRSSTSQEYVTIRVQ